MAISETEHGWFSAVLTNANTKCWAYVEVKARTQKDFLNILSTLVRLQASGGEVQVTHIQRIT